MPTISLSREEVIHLTSRDWRLARLIEYIGPLQYTQPDSAFSSLVHSIVEQMLSMKAAETIESRIRVLCEGAITPEKILAISHDDLRSCGVSERKAHALHELALFSTTKDLEELCLESDETIREQLMALPNVGKWTCDMFLLFYLERPDIIPVEDGAFRQAFQWLYGASVDNEGVYHVVCDLWRPYSSIAARYLYRALNLGLAKKSSAYDLLLS